MFWLGQVSRVARELRCGKASRLRTSQATARRIDDVRIRWRASAVDGSSDDGDAFRVEAEVAGPD